MAVPSLIHSADRAVGTNWEWQSSTMDKINNDCTFTMLAVERTSSALMRLLTMYRMASNTFCGTSLRAAATRHMEYNRIGGGEGLAKNSCCVMTGKIGAMSVKYAFRRRSMISRSICKSTGFGTGAGRSSEGGFSTRISPSPALATSHVWCQRWSYDSYIRDDIVAWECRRWTAVVGPKNLL